MRILDTYVLWYLYEAQLRHIFPGHRCLDMSFMNKFVFPLSFLHYKTKKFLSCLKAISLFVSKQIDFKGYQMTSLTSLPYWSLSSLELVSWAEMVLQQEQ